MLAIATLSAVTFCDLFLTVWNSHISTHGVATNDTNDWALIALGLVTIVLVLAAINYFDDFRKERERKRNGLLAKNRF